MTNESQTAGEGTLPYLKMVWNFSGIGPLSSLAFSYTIGIRCYAQLDRIDSFKM